jgi:hypothetical protein
VDPVYGKGKRRPGERTTWMDRFTELEPDGGFRTVFLAWQAKDSYPRK